MSLALAALGFWAASTAAPARARGASYVREVEAWRVKREADLRAPDGWLAVVGLHWLREGTSTIGSAKGNDIVLPLSAPPRVGTLDFTNGKAVIHVAPGVTVKSQDKPVADLELHSDKAGKPDVLTIGPVS